MPLFEAFLSDAVTDGKRDLVIVPDGATAPAAHTSIGEFEHDASHTSDVMFHHLRDLCYAEGIQDMMNINVKYDDEVPILSYTLSHEEVAIPVETSTTVLIEIRPAHGTMDDGVPTVVSDDTDTATVSINTTTRVITINGLVAGSAVVTVDYLGEEKTIAVTVVGGA